MQHSFSFDPTYGYDETTLLAVTAPSEPEGFCSFWRATYTQTLATPLNLEHREMQSSDPAVAKFEVEFDGLGGARVGAWLTVPRNGYSRGVVVGHGYGGREGPDDRIPGPPAAAIFPCARGFNRSRASGIPDSALSHVLHGIESRESYIHRMCAADLWSAASALLHLYPRARQCLQYQGTSFGGGLGAIALPWDHRFCKAVLDVPSFGNHPVRVKLPCVGSGEAVRLLYLQRPEVLSVLSYFDAAIAARHIHIPTLVGCALFDPAVPPPGQFSVFNCLSGPRRLFVRPASHFDYPQDTAMNEAFFTQANAWFS
jgi:cephalosporin-C deacetylase